MNIVFDMDNTLVDELGATKRPGIDQLLVRLGAEGHVLHLWTTSGRDRAVTILRDHDLRRYFKTCVYREDFDPDRKGLGKDIRKIGGDVLVDDDLKQINYMKAIGKKGVLVESYRKNMNIADTHQIYESIRAKRSCLSRLFGG
jgi:phosphoglycolate phosphatase-like HAD superfamily hydrolase